ncbi:phage antirepressor N-terminal domain-containing protein [Azospirillum argentinense]|uniref:Phage antirepressor N-terminal domain-containing protein n=1 Tax=Azospirillum argentinense TaxID=2970906 RepID=A0ABW8VB65_9PROT
MNAADLTTVPFHGATLVAVRGDTDATTLVAMKPVSEGMRLSWQPQHRKLLGHPVLSGCIINLMMQMPGDDQAREWVFLPLNRLNFWLATIHPNKVPDEGARAKIIEYQTECADALYQHFFAKSAQAKRSRAEEEARQRIIAQTRSVNAVAGLLAEVRRCMGARIAAEAAPALLQKVGVTLSGQIVPDPMLQPDLFETSGSPNTRPN